jgi:hypothetical protein
MWDTLLLINSIVLTFVAVFLVYSFGAMILLLEWKPFVFTLIVAIFLGFSQIALAAMAQP